MIQRILPIYQTGWFYLLLLFWAMTSWYISTGSLNQANQLNINLLNYLSPIQESSANDATLAATDILTLQSSFNESDIGAIKKLLSYYPESKITLLAQPSKDFMAKLEDYLSSTPRNNKVIISANNNYSGSPAEIESTMMLSSILNWLRFSQQGDIKRINSEHFTYKPLRLNQRQSYPLLWYQQGEIYLSLPGEILKQLSTGNELPLTQSWQLKLVNTESTLLPNKFSLGFLGEVFTTGKSYSVDEYSKSNQHYDELSESPLSSVRQFIKENHRALVTGALRNQYKVIIISDKNIIAHQQVKPLLINLAKNNYLSQNILTILLGWILVVIGLALSWLMRHLPIKQQLIALASYALVLLILQYFKFTQQQWFEVFPILLLVAGSWLLLQAYQKESNLFLAALNEQPKLLNNSSTARPVTSKNKVNNKSKQVYKSPQNFSPTAKVTAETTPPEPVEDLEQTLVIVESKITNTATMSHHLTVDNFGRYQVEGILGKGAMGIVYQGVDPKINRHVAIKTLQLSDEVDSAEFTEAKDRFFREAQTAGGLSHANIVTIYDVGEENNLGYIAMDLLTGAPLSLFTQPGQTLPVPLVYKLMMQITDALDYAHNQNVVHRDIKPANIIYDDDLLKVTVTDFGIAYVSDNSKTRTGIIMGSPYYMSPEQILGLKVDGRSDIFSLGVTFYQLLCGHLPFEGESIATVAYQITKAKAVAVNQRNAKLPASALRITNKAMHKDIDKRYQTMAEFKLALVNALKRDFKISAN